MSHNHRAKRGHVLVIVGTVLILLGVASTIIGGWSLLTLVSGPADSWDIPSELRDLALIAGGFLVIVLGALVFARGVGYGRSLPATFLTLEEERRVIDAVRRAEERTAGEIVIHLADHADGDVLNSAHAWFDRLGVARTAERSGVLFFVAVRQRRFAVVGDRGIHERVPHGFWDEIALRVQQRFTEGQYAGGLVEGVDLAGDALARFFPRRPDDVNELPDAISRET